MAFRVLQNCWVWRYYDVLLWGMAAVESIVSCSEEKSLMVRFPDPKQYLLLKQLEEWNIIVSCDKLATN